MKRFLSVVFTVACILACVSGATRVAALELSSLTVTMQYNGGPLEGLKIAVCLAADAKEENGSITFTAAGAFAGAGADFTGLTKEKNIALAAKLDAYAAANAIARTQKVTDRNGSAVFPGLSAGLYLVAQMEDEDSEYAIAPYLVMVPAYNERLRAWDYDVIAYPKTEPVKHDDDTTSVSVYKVWAGVDSPPGGSILAQLYRGGVPYGNSVVLYAGNRWSYTWEGLPPDGPWTVDERDVPAGYVKAITGSAATGFVITNTKSSTPPAGQINISGTKTWRHGGNPAAKQPKFIELRIFANGVFILQKRVTEAEHWNWSVRMDKYDGNGKEIVYTIDEAPVDGYFKAVDGFNLTNTFLTLPGTFEPSKPVKPHYKLPQTDDFNNPVFWMTLMTLSFFGLMAMLIRSRKQGMAGKAA